MLEFFSTKEDGVEHVFGGAGSPGPRDDVWDDAEAQWLQPHLWHDPTPLTPKAHARGSSRPTHRTEEFNDTMVNNLQAIWTDQVGFDEGVELTLELCQEILDKDPA